MPPPIPAPIPAPSATPSPVAPPAPAVAPTQAPAPAVVEPEAAPAAPPSSPRVTPPVPAAPGYSLVHLDSSYVNTWLELASRADPRAWRRACLAPCDTPLYVEGMLARVSAQRMTPSNAFRLVPGQGTAFVRVSGGSARNRGFGILGLVIGIPSSLIGGGLFGYGSFADRAEFRAGGAAALALGALSVVTAIPLLLSGTTTVRDGNGSVIARANAAVPDTF
ncbi:MAG TPA: hypothetical protein VMI54_00275 [Polyangiaceae bacterium]|nr:hypothetical protein [Polyangiaceae bacterium]